MRFALPTTVAVSLLAVLAGCSRHSRVAGETVLLDESITLVRGESLDTFQRELVAPVAGTCVAIVEENDGDLVLELQAAAADAASKAEVESGLYGEGIEVAAVPVARGSKLSIQLSMPPDMPEPTRVQTRVACHDGAAQTPETQARSAAYLAWSEATSRSAPASEESIKRRAALFDTAIKLLESDGRDIRMAAWAHLVKGVMLHDSLLDVRGALVEMCAAEKSFASLDPAEPRNVARARYHYAGALTEALNDATWTNPTPAEARAESEKIFTEMAAESSPLSPLQRARAVKFLGGICHAMAEYDCATRYFEQAVEAVRRIGHRREELSILHNLGVTAGDLGNFTKAVQYYDRVVPLVSKKYDAVDYVSFQQNAGSAYSNIGDTSRGITHMLLALDHARERESPLDLGRAMYALGNVYWRRGDSQQAETFFAESLKQRRIASDGSGLILSLTTMGRFTRFQGRPEEALAMHREALTRATTPNMKARGRYELALDYAAAGQLDRAIEFLRDIMRESDSVAPIRRAMTQILLAEYLIDRRPDAKSLDEADQLSQAALTLALENVDLVIEASARRVRAKLMNARRNYGDARREYESAIAVILDFRGATASPELQASTLAYEQETFREYVDLLMRGAGARAPGRFAAASQDEEDALRVLELARSGSAAARDLRLDAATQSRIDELLQEMAAKRVRISQMNNSSMPGGPLAEQLQLEMSRLRAEVDRLRGGASSDARSGKLPENISRQWPDVAAGITQLSYALGKRNAYLWTRDARGLRVAVLAETPARIVRSLADYARINQVRSPAGLEQALTGFSAVLLPAGALDASSSSLEIVADGSLGTLPFAALRDPVSGKRVIETHAVRLITSMFDVGTTPASAPRRMAFVGIASGTGKLRSAGHEFASLGSARAEARAIADLFGGGGKTAQVKLLTAADGDAETIRALWKDGSDAVHFATHGLANLRYPSASLLLLPKGGGEEPAYLTAGQVQEWRGDAGLVFLAACETAAGPARFAEGMSGLPRSFLGAGARGIVGTLWPVEDVYESQFSVEFYRRFIVSRDAEAALAETQREWLKPRAGERAGDHQQRLATAWAHVFYAKPKSL